MKRRNEQEFERVVAQAKKAMIEELYRLPGQNVDFTTDDALSHCATLWILDAPQIPACMARFVRTFA